MAYDPHKHRRRSIRLKGYDYSQDGLYFVTICVKKGLCLFGNIMDGEMILNSAGELIYQEWLALPERFPQIILDAFQVMPNHFYAILCVQNPDPPDRERAPTRVAPTVATLGDMVGAFKSITTHEYIAGIKELRWEPFPGKLWQRNYYEHIIRNEQALNAIRQYIDNNPANWDADQLHPDAPPNSFNQSW